jgi:hypothetical protein
MCTYYKYAYCTIASIYEVAREQCRTLYITAALRTAVTAASTTLLLTIADDHYTEHTELGHSTSQSLHTKEPLYSAI